MITLTDKTAWHRLTLSEQAALPVPTRQGMFDLAVRGLAAQAWARAWDAEASICKYELGGAAGTRRCAWGHVDPGLTSAVTYGFQDLLDSRIGVAAHVGYDDVQFARELQSAHDVPCGLTRSWQGLPTRDASSTYTAAEVRDAFVALGKKWDLVWPADVPLVDAPTETQSQESP